ncbi:site-specific DNA-methyltransferase [Ligilactobacillus ruminis]|uniref:site-specific DNA-methyltransferase n=1 Tax=Ligilactobacillus ruminis TaxID=1623 RepID=UPI003B9AA56A
MSTNISKKKREDLLAKIKEIRTFISNAPQDENTGNLLSYLSDLEKDVNGKKYGLVFEEHREEIDEVLDTHTPILTEDKDLFIDNGGQMNFLIEGDNLASLKLLEKTHKGKIDLIYIDPPYNTKNKDFVYDDSFVDNIDTFRHSKWISFLMPRLKLAKMLLKDNGVVFISIDDNEQAALKLLCDEIFGESNFVSQLVWEKKKKGSFLSNSITNIKEYILVYAKNILYFNGLIGQVNTKTETYPCINAVNKREIRHIPKGIKSNYKEKNYFLPSGTEISDTTMSIVLHSDLKIENGYLADELIIEGNWRYSQEAMYTYALNNEIYITRDLYLRRIVSQARNKMMKDLLPRVGDDINLTYNSPIDENDLFASGWGSNEDADEELRLIMGKQKIFDYPKPTRLLVKLLAATRNKNATCLDFFAGSGTTGHAVMKLNAEDGGNRKFILCTNNENNICRDVTYERIKRVIDKENYAVSLKYYKVDYIPISDRMYYEYADELLLHIRELVELENGVNFTGNDKIGIVLTEEELDDFISQLESNTKYQKLYLGHDILMDSQQAQILKNRKISINIIPDYYYKELEG